MASGDNHTKIAIAGAVVTVGAAYYFRQTEIGAYAAAGVIIGDLFLSPDLDGAFSNAKRRWGPLRGLWQFYEAYDHRSIWTHAPVLSDAIRNLYIAFMLGLTAAVLISLVRLDAFAGPLVVFGWINRATTLNPHLCLAFFVGQCINTTLHTTADIITSETKKVIDRKPARKRKATAGKRELRKAA